jgi:hypothetical protein
MITDIAGPRVQGVVASLPVRIRMLISAARIGA